MGKHSAKAEVAAFASFLIIVALLLTNGFSARIFAQEEEVELYEKIEPIGDVLAEVLQSYVYEPDIDKAVVIEPELFQLELRRFPARQQEENRDSQGVEIRSRRDLAVELLRRHVPDGAHKGIRSSRGLGSNESTWETPPSM